MGDQLRCQILDDGLDHFVQISDLIVEFEVAPREGLERDTVSFVDLAICREIGAPRSQGAD